MGQNIPPLQSDVNPVAELVRVYEVELTRPGGGDVNQYTAGDVIADSASAATVLKITDFFKYNGSGNYIGALRVSTNNKLWAGVPLRVFFFNDTITAQNDNAAYNQLYANAPKNFGHIDLTFDTAATGASTDMVAAYNEANKVLIQSNGTSDDLVMIVLVGAGSNPTPTSGQKFLFKVAIVQGG